jgi:hypothetical protein
MLARVSCELLCHRSEVIGRRLHRIYLGVTNDRTRRRESQVSDRWCEIQGGIGLGQASQYAQKRRSFYIWGYTVLVSALSLKRREVIRRYTG